MAKAYKVSFWGNENILKFTMVVDAQLCEYGKHNLLYTLNGWIVWYEKWKWNWLSHVRLIATPWTI